VACLIFLMPPDGRSLPSLTELGETDALESLLREVMNFPEVGASALATLIALVKRTRRFRLANGELDERAERVAAAASAPDWRSARSG
jgi:hypothetical protein